MYPYNRNTQLYHAALQMKEAAKPLSALSEDRRMLELLTMAQQETANTAERYAAMLKEETLAPSAQVIKAMYLDELKHSKQLQEAWYLLCQKRQNAAPKGHAPAEQGKALLEETLLMEMDEGDFYRTLCLSMPTEELRDIFYEISSDKQSHCNALCYLFSKYFC